MEPGFHCARTQWNRGFIAFQLARRTRIVMLMVPVRSESGFGTCRLAAAASRPGNAVLVMLMRHGQG